MDTSIFKVGSEVQILQDKDLGSGKILKIENDFAEINWSDGDTSTEPLHTLVLVQNETRSFVGIKKGLHEATHTFELMRDWAKKTDEMDILTMNYTASGIAAVIKDNYDGQQYDVTMTPKKDPIDVSEGELVDFPQDKEKVEIINSVLQHRGLFDGDEELHKKAVEDILTRANRSGVDVKAAAEDYIEFMDKSNKEFNKDIPVDNTHDDLDFPSFIKRS